ncbi:MAG: BTAD domain-containing putative transcriptional regulator [Alphaproteobacteria bacterium]
MRELALSLLGEFEIRDGAGQIIPLVGRKNRALLAILALAPGASVSRARAARLLWSDRADEQARSSLRQALTTLRKELKAAGAATIFADDARVGLDPERIDVDALAFRRLAVSSAPDDLRAAAALYRGVLLSDIEIGDVAFEEWLQLERSRFSDMAVEALEKLWAQERGAVRLDIAKRLVALDPLRESAHCKLIQTYAEAGERALALLQFEICRATLKTEFGIEPNQETTALRDGLIEGSRAFLAANGDGSAHSEQARTRPSVAVLPFDVMGEDPSLSAFADGLTEDVIASLARIRALRIVARNTVFTYKGRPVDIRNLGPDLGADYVVEGSVRRFSGGMRVSTQLIEVASGLHIWASRVDHIGAETVALQDEICSGVVASVQTQIILHEGRIADIAAQETATSLLARSWQQFLSLTQPSLAKSRALAERALALEPESGTAHRMLAVCLYHQVYMGFLPWTREALDDLYTHASQSIRAEDADEYCYWAMQCAYLLRKEHAQGLRSLQRALEINPSCSIAHGSFGTVHAWLGQPDEAIRSNELALRMNPDDPTSFFRHLGLSLAHYLASRYDQALLHVSRVVELRPQWWLALILHAASLAQLGRIEDACRPLAELARVRPGTACDTLWILPFANARDLEHLLAGLRKAGMPESRQS